MVKAAKAVSGGVLDPKTIPDIFKDNGHGQAFQGFQASMY